jgi:hypothetical protein
MHRHLALFRPGSLDEPFSAFPTWFIRTECGRCGTVRVLNEAHTTQRHMLLRGIIARMRHDGCGGRTGKAMLTLIPPPTE